MSKTYAALSKKSYLRFFRFINFGKDFFITALSDKKIKTFRKTNSLFSEIKQKSR